MHAAVDAQAEACRVCGIACSAADSSVVAAKEGQRRKPLKGEAFAVATSNIRKRTDANPQNCKPGTLGPCEEGGRTERRGYCRF